ncbi:odorant receptor 94a isoform X2 [Plodia interpunctella]|uniref:odorant receptor 94a isoform X2 n=1 Tax=Plodia interpunctella TaxID=58824 RepID=UPI0023674F1E|nr:odorant receptor 94a-like isoform X2 [Plodia interpunctella]
MESQLSYLSLHRNVTFLKMLGIYPIDPKSSKIKKFFHGIYRYIMFFFILLYTVQEIMKIYEGRHNADKVIETIFLLLTYTDYIFKIIVIRMKSDQIEDMLLITKGPIYNQGEVEHRAPLLNTIRAGLLFVRLFNLMTLFTCFLWGLQPTVQHLQGKSIELAIWLPFDVNVNPYFYFAVFYMWAQTSLLALGNSTVDSFVVYLLEQCKTQMTILRCDLENCVEKCKIQSKETPISFSENLEIRLIKTIIHHREIVKMINQIQAIFGKAIFYQFVVGGWILCTSAYRMVSINPVSVEFISMIFYMSCILIELFIYCYFGNEITIESNMIMTSAYATDWLAFPMKHRRMLIIFMERLKRPIQPLGSLIPLANSTYVSIIRSSYTFYAFLKNSETERGE